MAFERIELDVNANGVMKTFHTKQFDVGRPIILDLVNGDDVYTPAAGVTFELHCRKVDDNIVIISTYELDGNTLTFASTEQLTACVGKNLATVKMFLDDMEIGTMNFFLDVTIDPDFEGLTSETQIETLYEQVEEITEQVIGDNYYDKTEVDDLLDTKADASTTYTKTEVDTALNLKADKSDTYTKTETNNLLAGKADASDTYSKAQVDSKLSLKADKATTYTKTETDTLLGYKANASQVYTMSQTDLLLADKADKSTTYTKTQVDDALALKANSADLATVATTGDYDDLLNKPTIPAAQVQSDYAQTDNTQVDYIKNKPDIEGMIANALLEVMPIDTASGPIASFNTALAAPLVNVSCNVVATGGNGTPDSPNPINGYSAVNLTACGGNLADGDGIADVIVDNVMGASKDTANKTVTYQASNIRGLVIFDHFKVNTQYTFFINVVSGLTNLKIVYTDNSETELNSGVTTSTSGKSVKSLSGSWQSGTTVLKYNELGIMEGVKTAADFTPYTGNAYAIAFGQTVYGGVLDVTRGKLKPCVEYPSYNGETLSGRWLSSEATYIEGTTPPTGSQVVSLDDYGSDIDLTPVQIRALVGKNNVYSDTNGDTTVQFKDSIQHYIDTKVGS